MAVRLAEPAVPLHRAGCSFGVQPAVGGPRVLLLYDLRHVGGSPPPRLPSAQLRVA